MNTKLSHLQNRIARNGIATLPKWFGSWMFWNVGVHRLVPNWMIEDWRERAKYARVPKKYGVCDPIIIYQMGKVGSRTVYSSLEALHLDAPIYHLHFLNDTARVEKWVKEFYPQHQAYPMLRVAKKIRADMQQHPDKRWNLISMVRAPVPHEISVFFHLLHALFTDFETRQQHDPNFPQEVADYFVAHTIDDTPTEWFDLQVKELFGIDVYATPFPKERGYEVYEKDNIRLLLIRLEDMNRLLVPTVSEFLNVPAFEIVRDNIGEEKAYAKVYQEAMAHLKLAPAYLERKHSTRYAQHFYTPQELEDSIARWTRLTRPVPTKWDTLYKQWSNEGPLGMALWAMQWAMWKTRLYYALPPPLAEKVQARYRYTRRVKKYGIHAPIIVYQMGKVGSASMYASLYARQLNVPIYHLHFLNHADDVAAWAKKNLRVHKRELEMVALSKKLRREIERGIAPRYHLISLVRAPIPRNLSTYFYNIDSYLPNFLENVNAHTLSFQELAAYFVNEFHEHTPEQWFDDQVRQVFGLDVYAEPFARERGYQVYENANARLLVLRLEDLNRVAAPALREFLNIPDFTLVPANAGQDKKYGALYKEFLAALRLPRAYIEKSNATSYARHFYTEAELQASVARWV